MPLTGHVGNEENLKKMGTRKRFLFKIRKKQLKLWGLTMRKVDLENLLPTGGKEG